MNDLETTLAALLSEQVDHELGARRPAPPFVAPPRESTRPAWLMPLVAAACVLAVAGGAVGVGTVLADGDDQPAVGPKPTPSVSVPASLVPATTVEIGPPSVSRSEAPAVTTTGVDGARIAVPRGWTLTPTASSTDAGAFGVDAYCLRPAAAPADACTIQLGRITPPRDTRDVETNLDVDETAWGQGNGPQYPCPDDTLAVSTETASNGEFGGRAADYRLWQRSCHGVAVAHEVQYVVAAAPAWGLAMIDPQPVRGYTWATYLDVFDHVAHGSVLPAATSGVRYTDRGVVTRVHAVDGGVDITLSRQVQLTRDGRTVYVAATPASATYRAPASTHVSVGQRVHLLTDGATVILVRVES